jgi:hypothetical protein
MHIRWQTQVLAVFLAVGLYGLAWQRDVVDPLQFFFRSPGEVTLLVIMDTVRSDHLSVCGYSRPTSPTLERLVADGAHLSCEAKAPGSWTLPSHASFFTGEEITVHGAHAVVSGARLDLDTNETVRPLGAELPTLAERWVGQSVLVSANPVLGPASGLTRGFDVVRTPSRFGEWFGDGVVAEVRDVLRFHTTESPLLLVVNIADAHQPWLAVPKEVEWAVPRDAFRYKSSVPGDPWRTWFAGTHPDPIAFQAQITDLYDYAVYRSDQTLGRVLDVIAAYGRSSSRLLITSDHGEMLGEDGFIDHGHMLEDGNQNVFVLDSRAPLPEGPLNAMVVHDRILGLERTLAVRAAAFPHTQRAAFSEGRAFGALTARSWSPDVRWKADEPAPSEEAFSKFVSETRASLHSFAPLDSDLTEQLKAVGYLD